MGRSDPGHSNGGLLPTDFYALAEQVAAGPIPDVDTLVRIADAVEPSSTESSNGGGVAVSEHPPRVKYSHEAERDVYAVRASRVVVFHSSGDRIVGYIEIVSPGNKHSELTIDRFTDKLADALRRGCHVMVIDLHPPTRRDPRGIHAQFWQKCFGDESAPGVTDEQPFGLASYRCDLVPRAYFERASLGDQLIDMPAFLTPDLYVNVPLESTYLDAWRGVPARWKRVIETDETS